MNQKYDFFFWNCKFYKDAFKKISRVFFSAVGSDSGLIGMNGCLQTYPPQGHRLTHLGQIINQDFCFTLDTTNFGSTVNIQNSTQVFFL